MNELLYTYVYDYFIFITIVVHGSMGVVKRNEMLDTSEMCCIFVTMFILLWSYFSDYLAVFQSARQVNKWTIRSSFTSFTW